MRLFITLALSRFALVSFIFASILMGGMTHAQPWEDRQIFSPPEGQTQGAIPPLRVLSSTDTSLFAPIIRDFVTRFPGVAVDYMVTGTADIDRVFRANPAGFDVVISSAMDLQIKLTNDGFAKRLPAVEHPDWAQWRQGVFAFTSEPAAIVINRAAFDGHPVPRTRQDLIAALRALIEVELASRALPRAHIALIDRLTAINSTIAEAIAHKDAVAYIRTNLEFHRTLYLRAQAPAMLAMCETVWLQLGPTMRALYGLAAYADAGRLYEVHMPATEQKYARLSCLVETLSARELNALALHYCWKQKNTEGPDVFPWMKDLLFRLGKYHTATREVVAPPGSRSENWLLPLLNDGSITLTIDEQIKNGWDWRTRPEKKDIDSSRKNIILVAPSYRKLDLRKKRFPALNESDSLETVLEVRLAEQLSKAGYSTMCLRRNNRGQFQEYISLQNWEAERRLHKDIDLISSQYTTQLALLEKMETPFFLWAGVVSQTERKDKKMLRILAGIPILPYTLIKTFSPKRTTFIYMILYSLETGEVHYQETRAIPRADRQDVISSTLYDMILMMPH